MGGRKWGMVTKLRAHQYSVADLPLQEFTFNIGLFRCP